METKTCENNGKNMETQRKYNENMKNMKTHEPNMEKQCPDCTPLNAK